MSTETCGSITVITSLTAILTLTQKPTTKKSPVKSRKTTTTSRSAHRVALSHNQVPNDVQLKGATYEALSTICEKHQLTHDAAVELLIHFYQLRMFDLLIEKIRAAYNSGLSATQINQLSVLYSLLAYIDQRIGLR